MSIAHEVAGSIHTYSFECFDCLFTHLHTARLKHLNTAQILHHKREKNNSIIIIFNDIILDSNTYMSLCRIICSKFMKMCEIKLNIDSDFTYLSI